MICINIVTSVMIDTIINDTFANSDFFSSFGGYIFEVPSYCPNNNDRCYIIERNTRITWYSNINYNLRTNLKVSLQIRCPYDSFGPGSIVLSTSFYSDTNFQQMGEDQESSYIWNITTSPNQGFAESWFRITYGKNAGDACWIDDFILTAEIIQTNDPTVMPTKMPSNNPTKKTVNPTKNPTETPTRKPTETPTINPSMTPSVTPTLNPSLYPTNTPTNIPSLSPSETPTATPTLIPSSTPSGSPSKAPSISPTICLTRFENNVYDISKIENNMNYTGQMFNKTVNNIDINIINCNNNNGCQYECNNALDCFDQRFQCNSSSYVICILYVLFITDVI